MKQPYNQKIDVWSATIVVFALLNGHLPFDGNNMDDMRKIISESDLDLESDEYSKLSLQAKSFICSGLVKDPSLRMTSADMLKHPWLADVKVPKLIHIQVKCSVPQSMFLARSGHEIPWRDLRQLLKIIIQKNSPSQQIDEEIEWLHKNRGCSALNQMIRDYLRGLEVKKFNALLDELVDNELGFYTVTSYQNSGTLDQKDIQKEIICHTTD